jgi:NhaA family Na+:H+ antiporter
VFKNQIKTFFKSEIAIGVLLLVATVLALLISNSKEFFLYQNFFSINLSLPLIHKDLTILDWINDFLMAIFFLLIGLELKREILIGELSSKKKISLPLIAALGGIIFPALIFIFFNFKNSQNLAGLAIPTATDIAFAYGIISLFGKKIPSSLKIFLVALAIIDDLAAILIIAFFYTKTIDLNYLSLAALILLFLFFLNLKNSAKISFYLILGIFLWLAILKSGIHATMSGVLLALFIPLQAKNKVPLANLAHKIAPTVNFLILPLFAFANAGVKIEKFSPEIFLNPLSLGVACGLFFGKQTGVMLFSFAAVKSNIATLPRAASWFEFYAASILTGIGFTMSLFIAKLAFIENDSIFLNESKIGILLGSLLSIIYGISVLILSIKSKKFLKS